MLFASLAWSAFLIYPDPHHGTNSVRTLVVARMMAFALRAGSETNLALFGLAVGVTAVLVALERVALGVLARATTRG